MPHSTTKVARNKRPDTRPNGKLRRALKAKVEASKTIQDLRVTKVQKNEKKDRLAQVTTLVTLSKNEKKLRALKKKIKAIEELYTARDSGAEMDGQQLHKMGCLDDLLLELDGLMNMDKNNKRT